MFSSGIWSILTVYLMFLWSSSTDGRSDMVVLLLSYVLFEMIRAILSSPLKGSCFWFLSGWLISAFNLSKSPLCLFKKLIIYSSFSLRFCSSCSAFSFILFYWTSILLKCFFASSTLICCISTPACLKTSFLIFWNEKSQNFLVNLFSQSFSGNCFLCPKIFETKFSLMLSKVFLSLSRSSSVYNYSDRYPIYLRALINRKDARSRI